MNNRTFQVDCPKEPTFNSSRIEIDVHDIYAPNKTIIYEDDYISPSVDIWSKTFAASFEIEGTGHLDNVSVLVSNPVDEDPAAKLTLKVYTSKWDESNQRSEPDSKYGSDLVVDREVYNFTGWYNFTNLNKDLDIAVTENNTFFVVISTGAQESIFWRKDWDDTHSSSQDNSDDLDCYQETSPDVWTFYEIEDEGTDYSIDFTLKCGFFPENNEALPSDIDLEINNTDVSDSGSGNSGTWTSENGEFGDSDGVLNFTIDAGWWDVTCNITKIQVNYTKTDLIGITNFTLIKNAVNVNWNSDVNDVINSFDSRFENFYINFTVPATWENLYAYNASTQKTVDISGSTINGYKNVTVWEAGNGTNWYLTATSPNLISSIDIHDINSNPIIEANYSDTVYINATFDTKINSALGNDQAVNLSIYSPEALNNLLNHTFSNTTFNKEEIGLNDWVISAKVLEYGLFRVQVFWSNDTAAGFNETLFTIYGNTNIDLSTPKNIFNVDETFNITVNFTDSGQNKGIDGANINYTLDGTNWRYDNITSVGNGIYNITIDCDHPQFNDYGEKTITVNASKQYYNNQTDSFDITILAKTNYQINDPGTIFNSDDIFNITIQYNDTRKIEGILDADINYTLNGNRWRYDNVTHIGEGKYNITVYCNDTDFNGYGPFTITVNASKQDYHNISDSSIQISITGVNLLSIESPSDGSQYYSTELFNITVNFEDTSRNEGIDGANIEVDVIGEGDYSTPIIDPLENGRYNITINCSRSIFSNYGPFTIRINASKTDYENDTASVDVIIIGNTSLSVLYPPTGAYYGPTGEFNITILYYDIVKEEGITGADLIEYNIDGSGFKSVFVFDLGNGQYNITIDTEDADFDGYGPKIIPIKINKTKYHNTSATYSFNLEISTTISPDIGPINLPSIFRGDNVSYTFNYSDMTGKSIEGASWDTVYDEAGFIETPNMIDDGNGNYTMWLNSTGVLARENYYTFIFNISAPGNQTQEITLRVTILLPRTEVVDYTEVTNVEFGLNITLSFVLKNNYTGSFIDNIGTENVSATNLAGALWYVAYGIDPNFTTNGGWELYFNANGNYTLNISTFGLENGGVYTVIINITYYSSNPGPYNYSIITFQFTYGTVATTPSDGGGGGGGGGGGSTTVTGLAMEDLMFYIIIIGAVVGIAAAIVGVQKGVIAPKKREKERILREVTTVFDDAINLEHLLVIYKGTGTCIYFKSYGMEEIDPELISGFLTAVSSFGREMDSQEALNEIKYGDKMLLLADGKFIRVALVLEKSASIILRQHLKDFIEAFEVAYADALPKWRGQINVFRDAGELVDDRLHTSIILPHEIKYDLGKVKALKSPHSKDVLKIANSLVEGSDRKFFFIATLLIEAVDKTGKDKAEIFMGIKELRDSNLLVPIQLTTIEEQPVSQQELNLISQKLQEIPGLAAEERQKLVNDVAKMSPAEREAYIASLTEQKEIVSAPIKSKAGEVVIDNVKSAKKEVNNLRKKAKSEVKRKNTEKGIGIYREAAVIATNWDLTKEFENIEDEIRIITISDLKSKMKILEAEAKLAAKAGDYPEAAEKYSLASDAASKIFKLGITEMTKEVKRLTNKSKEFGRLS